MSLGRALVLSCVLALPMAGRAHHAQEAPLKSAFIYNFIVLATWPEVTGAKLRLCVAGPRGPTPELEALEGKAARGRTLAVAGIAAPEGIGRCHALFIPRSEVASVASWLAAASPHPVLTITDNATARGQMISMRNVGDQVVFDVDVRAATAARIVLSSQLIKLAARRL